MRIPLRIVTGSVNLNVIIYSQYYHIGLAQISFVVDTGSNETFISEGDALRFNIPINKLPFEKHVSMAGSKFELLKAKSLILYIKKDDNKTEKISLDHFYVARGTKKDEKNRNLALAFPSIMGLDFLENNKFSLVVTPHKNLAYLEKEENERL